MLIPLDTDALNHAALVVWDLAFPRVRSLVCLNSFPPDVSNSCCLSIGGKRDLIFIIKGQLMYQSTVRC